MRVLFAGGGTGGHLYPGLAIARALVRARPDAEPFFVGAHRGIEREILPQSEFPYLLLDLHPLYRSRPWENWRTLIGGVQAWRELGGIVAQRRPAIIVGTGGYAAGVAMAYAVSHRILLVQQAGDSVPGIAARAFSRWSRQMYLAFPEAARYLTPHHPGALLDTGAPIEPPPKPFPDRSAARSQWGFPPTGGRVLLIYGGSQGSAAINRAVRDWLVANRPADLFVIWATGRANYEEFRTLEREHVRVRDYLSPVSDAYAAADLALTRAGAMTTAELLAWHIPAVLVPLPTAAADHQTRNAKALEEAGAAVHLPQARLTGAALDAVIGGLLANPAKLALLTQGAAARARPDASADIAQHILQVIDTET